MPGFKPIDRRKLLRGVGGVAMGLPLLEAMASTREEVVSPKRMIAAGIFYGLVPEHFHPQQVGREYELPKLLQPLSAHRDDFTVFSGLDHNIGGGHSGTKYFLTGIPLEHSSGYTEGNISVDQKAASFVGSQTRYPSLVLGCESGASHRLSWTQNSQAVQPIERLSDLFRLLFRDPTAKERKSEVQSLADRDSILDVVRGQAGQFKNRLSKADTEKLDQYFTSVRELELRVKRSADWLDEPKPKTDYRLKQSVDALTLREKTPIFYDLMALALQTDSTRVITLSFLGLGKDNGGLPGVKSGYHTLSHHGKVPSVVKELTIIESFHTTQFARFLDKLKSIKEPSGESLLNQTMSLFGSGMSSGNSHSNRDLPVLLAGGGFQHGQHLHFDRERAQSVSLNNLFLKMLQNFGMPIDKFNNSTGTLDDLEVG